MSAIYRFYIGTTKFCFFFVRFSQTDDEFGCLKAGGKENAHAPLQSSNDKHLLTSDQFLYH